VDKATCARRAEIAAAISGHGFHSAKFACKDRKAMFRPGQRVTVDWKYWDNSGDGMESCWNVQFRATVLQETSPKFVIRIDPDQEWDEWKPADIFRNKNMIVKARPADMTAIAEPDISFCKYCYGLPQWGTCFSEFGGNCLMEEFAEGATAQ
jgi:hypothetical protein